MTVTWLTGDVFDVMATLPDQSFDFVVTSPPFWRQRAYLPADHPDKAKEIGQEATPAEFIAVMLRLTAEWRRLLTPYGSIAVELGDTMAGSGGAGGDYVDGFRPGQPTWRGSGSAKQNRYDDGRGHPIPNRVGGQQFKQPRCDALPKSHCFIPEMYGAALTYGDWPILTGNPHPAGQWIVRNKVVWCRPNPTPGDDGDKFRRAWSMIVCATLNPRRWWDGEAVRETAVDPEAKRPRANAAFDSGHVNGVGRTGGPIGDYEASGTRPLYDHWLIAPHGYSGAHYAVWTPEIARRLILAMCPARVCRECGEPSRRIVGEPTYEPSATYRGGSMIADAERPAEGVHQWNGENGARASVVAVRETLGWTDCGHNAFRPGRILDPFGGSGTTGMVASGNARDCTLIDIDNRNLSLARERVGMFLEVPS